MLSGKKLANVLLLTVFSLFVDMCRHDSLSARHYALVTVRIVIKAIVTLQVEVILVVAE